MANGRAGNNAYDAIVIGGGPNGLAAAVTLAEARRSVLLIEAKATVGGGTRTRELTLPGFRHDVCSAVHPLALASPFFRSLNLPSLGVDWIQAPAPLAHPLDNGRAVVLEHSLEATAGLLGEDQGAYLALFGQLVRDWKKLVSFLLVPGIVPSDSLLFFTFACLAFNSAMGLAMKRFKGEKAQALFCGCSAHSVLPLTVRSTAAFGLLLIILGHAVGWPIVKGGSQAMADVLASRLLSLGGEIRVNQTIRSIDELPKAQTVLFDTSAEHFARLAAPRLTPGFLGKLKHFQHGPGVFKIDWALDAQIPWKNSDCSRAGTLHIAGGPEEIAKAENEVWQGIAPEKPFVLLSQPSLFDPTRAPHGRHTAWAYCHVPNGSKQDMTDRIEDQIERFAPGFKSRILARCTISPAGMEEYNPNYVGGDIIGGVNGLPKIFGSPFGWLRPYATPAKGLYLCSSSTPPGAGVHGMCGHLSAKLALKQSF